MSNSNMRLRRLAGVAVGVGVVTSAFLTATPAAHAYSNEWPMTTVVNTWNCDSTGDRRATKVSGGCYLRDQADGTFWHRDSGGRGIKIEVYTGTTLRGKVEFHPYSEKLWIYDTSNDGDTIYVDVKTEKGTRAYRPPGTSKKIDYEVVDMSLSEGSSVTVDVFDGYSSWGGLDKIAAATGRS